MEEEANAAEYDYLLGMPMWNLTLEKKEEFLRKKEGKNQELRNLKATTKEDLWRKDLKEFVEELDKIERKQLEQQQFSKKGVKKKDAPRKKGVLLPSPDKGLRIVPKISDDLKRKASAAAAAKDKKNAKNAFGKSLNAKMAEFDEPDEFDAMADDKEHNRSLSDRLGVNLKAEEKSKRIKARKENTGAAKSTKNGKKTRKDPWDDGSNSSSGYSIDDFSDSASDAGVSTNKYVAPARDRPGRERKTVSYKTEMNSESDTSGNSNTDNEAPQNGYSGKTAAAIESDTENSDIQETQTNVKGPAKQAKLDTMFLTQDSSKKESEEPGSDNAFDSLLENGSSKVLSTTKIANGNAVKNGNIFDSDSDEPPAKHKNGGKSNVQKHTVSSINSPYQSSDECDSNVDRVGQSSSKEEFRPRMKLTVEKKNRAPITLDRKVIEDLFICSIYFR